MRHEAEGAGASNSKGTPVTAVEDGTGRVGSYGGPVVEGKRRGKKRVAAAAVALILGVATSAYAAEGDLDPSFDADGKATASFGVGKDVGRSVAVQPDGKIVTAGYREISSEDSDFALTRHNADGTLDATFGNGGAVTTHFGSTDEAHGVALQPDGKIVVAGFTIGPPPGGPRQSLFALARYNTNGTLDTSFGGDGKVVTDFFFQEFDTGDRAHDVVIQPDGKIVAAGYYGGSGAFAFARYNPDGSPDATFGNGGCTNCTGVGTTVVDFGVNDEANSVAIQPDGKIVAAGRTATGFPSDAPSDFALVRLNSNGSRDTSFGADGKVTTSFSSRRDEANGVAVQPDGRIVAVGSWEDFSGGKDDFALARYNADGALDSSFGTGGLVSTSFGPNVDIGTSVALQADDKIVAAGSSTNGSGINDFALARYNPGGSLDSTFSADGKVTTNFNGGADEAYGVAIQPKGKIVAAGSAGYFMSPNTDFALARYEGPPPPPNDDFADAKTVSGTSVSVDGSSLFASRESGEPDHWTGGSLGENSVWYSWTAPASGQVTMDTCTSSFDTVLAVYTGSAIGGLAQTAADDDACDAPNVAGSRLTFGATAGTTYRIAVSGYFTYSDGPFTLRLTAPDPAAPTVTVRSPEPGARYEQGQTVIADYSCADEPGGSGLQSCQGTVPDGAPIDTSAPGTKSFGVSASDNWGNAAIVSFAYEVVVPPEGGEVGGEPVRAGETATTDDEGDGATASDPIETSLTSPVAGNVSITERPTSEDSPSGFDFLGQQVEITAPDATAQNPLRLVFTLDASQVPQGENQDTIQIFRNGVRVQNCADGSGAASPDPCVLEREAIGGGDLRFGVLSSRASVWNLGKAAQPPRVASVTPSGARPPAPPTTNVSAVFSEDMDEASVEASGVFTLTLKGKRGKKIAVPATVSYDAESRTLTLDPSAARLKNGTYTAKITTGARDATGAALAANRVWTFKVSR